MAKIALTPYVGGLAFRWTEAKTASYTCTKQDSGTIFHTTGATAAVTFTLPQISDGPFYFLFICGADIGMTVTAATADTAVTFNDLAADSVAFSTSSEMIGAQIEVICDGTTLFVLPRLASEAQTVTIATA
jgi:hypothetical protein